LMHRPAAGYALLLAWVLLLPAGVHAASGVAFRGLLLGTASNSEGSLVSVGNYSLATQS